MKTSVIIPTLNAAHHIERLTASLLSQTVVPLEIIIIDSSSEDDTVTIAEGLGCRTLVIKRDQFNHGSTRNLAARHARGEILIFMTQDAIPIDTRLIEYLTGPLDEPGLAATFARQIPDQEASQIERFSRSYNYPDTPVTKSRNDLDMLGIKTFYFSNVCSAVKRRIFFEAGGFPDIIMNEDMILASRFILRGYKVFYQAKAGVSHSHSYTLMEQLRRYFDIGITLRDHDILQYSRPTGEGKRFIIQGVKYFSKRGILIWLIPFLIDALFRYTGYYLGIHYRRIPKKLWKGLSMHPFYFK